MLHTYTVWIVITKHINDIVKYNAWCTTQGCSMNFWKETKQDVTIWKQQIITDNLPSLHTEMQPVQFGKCYPLKSNQQSCQFCLGIYYFQTPALTPRLCSVIFFQFPWLVDLTKTSHSIFSFNGKFVQQHCMIINVYLASRICISVFLQIRTLSKSHSNYARTPPLDR